MPRVAFVVLDGLPPDAVGPEITPVLEEWCRASGTSPHSVPAVLPASTYPNHATFVTGVRPPVNGIVGNHVRCEEGRWLCFAGIDGEAGMHGSPRTAMQLAAVVGAHPAVGDLEARVGAPGFDATSWYGELCGLLGLTQPPWRR